MAKYVIEVNGEHNETLIFPPIRQRVRGRWSASRTAHRDKSGSHAQKQIALKTPEIPGQFIEVDTTEKTGRIIETLADTEGGALMWETNLKPIIEANKGEMANCGTRLPETQVFKLDADAIKLWLFHMRTAVDTGVAGVVSKLSNQLPSIEDIQALPGKRKSDPMNSGPREEKLKGRDFVDDVPAVSGSGSRK
jgi:hypothetical protein